jgi:hypothetical protein
MCSASGPSRRSSHLTEDVKDQLNPIVQLELLEPDVPDGSHCGYRYPQLLGDLFVGLAKQKMPDNLGLPRGQSQRLSDLHPFLSERKGFCVVTAITPPPKAGRNQ